VAKSGYWAARHEDGEWCPRLNVRIWDKPYQTYAPLEGKCTCEVAQEVKWEWYEPEGVR